VRPGSVMEKHYFLWSGGDSYEFVKKCDGTR
jgi:hypothetical protein